MRLRPASFIVDSIILLFVSVMYASSCYAASMMSTTAATNNVDQVLKVYRLQHTAADEAAAILESQIGGFVRITPDMRTNALIISGQDQGHDMAHAILAEIDVPLPESSSDSKTVVLDTRDIARQMDLNQLVNLLTTNRRVERIAVQTDGSIVLQGSLKTIQHANSVLETLREMHKQDASVGERFLRVIWLVSDHDGGSAPGSDLKPVVDELSALGVRNLSVASQVMVQTHPNSKFEINSTGEVEGPCRFMVQGFLHQDDSGSPIASIEIVTQSIPQGPEERHLSTSIQTDVVCPDGHFIVLGAAPTGAQTSVFVVQSRASQR